MENAISFVQDHQRVITIEVTFHGHKNFCYLVVDTISNRSVLVDPAWEMEKIEEVIKDTGSILSGVLLTHAHMDHIHLSKDFSEKYHCPIWMSQAEVNESGYSHKNLVCIEQRAWSVGYIFIKPLLTPGHTPGCVCYLIGKSLFSGDVLFAEGCGVCPSDETAGQMYDSLETLKGVLKKDTRIFPGHTYGKPVGQPFSNLLADNIYLQFSNKESFVAFRMRARKRIRA